jgi:NAD(P)-dependent dehydrogenase (short-subunit alcohol dehydrogenase family)
LAEGDKGMNDRVALVTGGASGIGEACARRFARDGYRVAILDRDGDRAGRVSEDIARGGTGCVAHVVDVADPGALDAAVAAVAGGWGRIDACVTAAGLLETVSTIMDMDLTAHERIWKVNYNGTLHTCRAVGRVMQEQGSGAIVTLGSINSFAALPLPAYCPSKTAILRLTEMLAVELGRFGIRVNGVAPTYVLTPAVQAKIDSGERDAQVIRRSNALGIFVEPADVAEVAAFLCSDAARAVSGVMLPVDAGHLSTDHYFSFAGGVPWER